MDEPVELVAELADYTVAELEVVVVVVVVELEVVVVVVVLEVPVGDVVDLEAPVVAAELEAPVAADLGLLGFDEPEEPAAVDIGELVVVVEELVDVGTVELAAEIVEPVAVGLEATVDFVDLEDTAGEFHLCSMNFDHNKPKEVKTFSSRNLLRRKSEKNVFEY